MKMSRLCKNCPALPVVRKCCFCVPIRRGVTIFAYVNLVLSLLSFPLLIFLLVEHLTTGRAVYQEESGFNMNPLVHLPLTIAFVVVDVVMNIVLLIGAHKKNRVLLKSYLYFGLAFQLLTLCTDLVYFDFRDYVENAVYFIFLGLNFYILYLVYSTVKVIEEDSGVQYVVHHDHHQYDNKRSIVYDYESR